MTFRVTFRVTFSEQSQNSPRYFFKLTTMTSLATLYANGDTLPPAGTPERAQHDAEHAQIMVGLIAVGQWCHQCRESRLRCEHVETGA